MEDDNQLSEEDLAKKLELETFEDLIWTEINKMRDEGLTEYEFNNMIFKLNNETGEISLLFSGTDIKFATIHEETGIEYDVKAIKAYEDFLKDQEIENKLPEGLPDIETLKERQGDDTKQKEHDEPEEEKEPEEREEIKEEQEEKSEEKQEDEKQQNKDDERKKVYKNLPKNAIKLNKNRMADPRKKVGEELEKATKEKGVEFYVAPVGSSNNLEYKLFVDKNGIYEEVDLPTPRGTNPTDNIMRMSENNIDDKTAVSILYIGEDRAITIFDGGPYAEADIANRDREGEFSSMNIEKSTEQGKIGYASREIREAAGDTPDARISVEEKKRTYYELNELEQRDVPNEINPAKDKSGIELTELSDKEFRNKVKEGIKNELLKEGKREVDAENIATKMTEKIIDKDMEFDVARNEAELENGDAGRTPWDDLENKEHRG